MERPAIVVTLSNPERSGDAALAELKNRRYLEALERAGAEPLPLDDRAAEEEREAAFAAMDGLLISGGADVDPARYGEAVSGAQAPDLGRDALDAEAFAAAWRRGTPVLGICRGLQAINVFRGGSLVQHLDGHQGEAYPAANAGAHPIDIVGGTRLASIAGEPEDLVVNSYHHQAVTEDRLAPGLRIAAAADHPVGRLVEALESTDPGRWLVGIQCHPERTESSPPVLDRLWSAFVVAAGGFRRSPAAGRRP